MKPRLPAPQPPVLRLPYGPPLVIALLVLLCFSPVLHNDFVNWDDDLTFTDNPHYRGLSLTHLAWMFTTTHVGQYRPLTWVTYGIDYTLWGMNSTGYHLSDVLLHAANAVLVYLLVHAFLTRVLSDRPQPHALAVAAAVGALFFALHPLRVEAVAWATERQEPLCGFFFLLTLLTYLRMYDEKQAGGGTGRKWYLLSISCFALSLLSKPAASTLPIVLLVLDVYPLGRLNVAQDVPSGRSRARVALVVEKIPYAVLSLAAVVAAFIAKQPEAMIPFAEHGLSARAAQSAYGLCFYLWKTVAPFQLSPLYLLQRPLHPSQPKFILSVLLATAATAAALLYRRRFPWALTAWACYVFLVAPVLGFVQNGPQIAADRYTYIPCLPWAVLLAVAVAWLERSRQRRGRGRLVRPMLLAVVAAALGVLGLLTYAQTQVWRDSLTLWTHALAVEPDNYVAYTARGKARQALQDVDGALGDLDTALRLNPVYAEALVSRGNALQEKGALDAAIADFTNALRRRPRDARTYVNRGNARRMKGDLDGALADYNAGLHIDPELAAGYYRRGNIHRAKGEWDAALADYSQALRLDPTDAYAYNNRAVVREAQGDVSGAFADYRAALRLVPASGPFQRNVARARQLAEHATIQ